MERNAIIKDVKKNVWIMLIVFLSISCLSVYVSLVNNNLSWISFMSIGLGVFIIYSLLNAKSWAKNYIVFAGAFIILITISPLIKDISTLSWSGICLKGSLIAWLVYIIRYLNVSKTYEKYVQLVNSGISINKDQFQPLEDIIGNSRLINIQADQLNSSEDYLSITKKIFSDSQFTNQEINFSAEENEVNIETEEEILSIEIDKDSIFPLKDFINKIKVAVDAISESAYQFVEVYPEGIHESSIKQYCTVSKEVVNSLNQNGYRKV